MSTDNNTDNQKTITASLEAVEIAADGTVKRAAATGLTTHGSSVELTVLKKKASLNINVDKQGNIDVELLAKDLDSLKPEVKVQLKILFQKMKRGLVRQNFTYVDFKIIIDQIVDVLPTRLKKKIPKESFTEDKFERLKREVRERKARMQEWMNEHPEFLKLNNEQLDYLNSDPAISNKIAGILRQVNNNRRNKNADGTLNYSKAIVEFKSLYNQEVYKMIQKFIDKIKKLLTNPQKAKKDQKFYDFLKKNFGVTDPRGSGIAKILGAGSKGLGSLLGGTSGYQLLYLMKNNNIEKFIGQENVQLLLMQALAPNANHEKDVRKILNDRFDEIFKLKDGPGFKNNEYSKTVLQNIENTFTSFNGAKIDKGEGKVEDVEFILEKLKTIPKGWHNISSGSWCKKYEKYVLKTGKGSLDFDDWIDTQNVNMIQRAMAWFKSTFSDILGFFGFGKNDKKFKSIEHYEDLLGETNESETDKGDKREPEVKARENHDALKNIADDLGMTLDQIEIQYKGKQLIKNGKVNNQLKLSALNNIIEKLTQFIHAHKDVARKFLTKKLDLKDLIFLAEHDGEDNPDGINIGVGADGLEFSYDWGKTMTGIFDKEDFGGWMPDIIAENELGTAVGVGGVILACIWSGGLAILPALIGGGVGALVGEASSSIAGDSNTGDKKLSFKDLNSKNLKLKIREFKIYVGKIKNKIKSLKKEDLKKALDFYGKKFNWQSIDNNFPKSLISKGKMNPSLVTLLNLPQNYWNGYKMTLNDLNNFKKGLAKGIFDETGVLGDSFHIEDNKIEINGSGLISDKKVGDVKGFFNWIKSKVK